MDGSEDEDITTLRVQSDRSLGAVSYLEECLGQMKNLILHTMDQDARLN